MRYPTRFSVREFPHRGIKDSVEFMAPDKSVAFYFAAPDAKENPDGVSRESATDSRNEKSAKGVFHWRTVSARDGSYSRSWLDSTDKYGFRTVFGIRYRNKATCEKYAARYAAFKKSLETAGE